MANYKKWLFGTLISVAAILTMCAAFVIVEDPYFHYHKPLANIRYNLDTPRYQNDGVAKHFEYDALITGSSMTECFRPSEMKDLFGYDAVKLSFSGGSYKEVNELVMTAAEYNPDLKMVVRGLDGFRYFDGKDDVDYVGYPTYLYDKVWYNDVQYVCNMTVFMRAVCDVMGKSGNTGLDFDRYCNWNPDHAFGAEAVKAHYDRDSLEKPEQQRAITDEEYVRIRENIEQNIIATAVEYPDVDFYLYYTPYSIFCLDYWNMTGELDSHLYAQKYITELLLPYENIHIYSFWLETEVITNPDNYRDVAHHSQDVNSMILKWISEGQHELTQENYEAVWQEEYDLYTNYDYDTLMQSYGYK